MPPFLGQGMCFGIRDVNNLVWKLDLVLRGLAPDAVLDSYGVERKPHVAQIIEQAVALGKVSCMLDPEQAKHRDQALLAGHVPPPPPFPWLEQGILQQQADAGRFDRTAWPAKPGGARRNSGAGGRCCRMWLAPHMQSRC